MDFEIIYFVDSDGRLPVEEFLLNLGNTNKVLQAKSFLGITKLRNSAYHIEPLSKYLEPGLWELRIKAGNDILRIIYTFRKGRIIILLHIFIKKQQKTLVRELELARKRLNEIRAKEGN